MKLILLLMKSLNSNRGERMFYDKDKVKNSLSIDDIVTILNQLRANPQKTSEGVVAQTICHNGCGEGSEKLYYYDNTKLFHCYTECGSMDIFELIMRVYKIEKDMDISFYSAIVKVAQFFNLEQDEIITPFEKNTDLEIIDEYKALLDEKNQITISHPIYSEEILHNLDAHYPLNWLQEGIGKEAMDNYEIKYYATTEKIVIPHRNINGDLIGIRGRATNELEAAIYGKYRPLTIGGKMYNHPLSQNLYGLHRNLENINTLGKVIIFEGEKSVMHYETMFGAENNISVATCGSSLSIIQEKILQKFCDVNEVIIAYDKEFEKIGDLKFKRNVAFLTRMAHRLKPYFNVSIMFDKNKEEPLLNYKDAPIDQGKDVFLNLYENRIQV